MKITTHPYLFFLIPTVFIILLSCSAATDTESSLGLEITKDFDDPVVEILSPSEGDTLTGNTTIDFYVQDFTGVNEIQFLVNQTQNKNKSKNYKSKTVANTNSLEWDTRQISGNFDIKLIAIDSFGNVGESDSINITIENLIFQEFYDSSNSILDSDNIVSIQFDSEGKAYVATPTGLYTVSGNSWSPITIDDLELSRENIISTYIDQFDSLWVSSSINTNIYINRIYFSYKDGQTKIGAKTGFIYESVLNFFRDVDGTLWLGTGDGLFKKTGGIITEEEEFGSAAIYDMGGNKHGYPIIGISGGIYNFNGNDWVKVESDNNRCGSFKLDSEGVIWCIDDNYGIPSAYRLYRIENNILKTFKKGFSGRVLAIDEQNNKWFGSQIISKLKNDEFVSYDITIDGKQIHNSVNQIIVAPDGRLWIGTIHGLFIAEF